MKHNNAVLINLRDLYHPVATNSTDIHRTGSTTVSPRPDLPRH